MKKIYWMLAVLVLLGAIFAAGIFIAQEKAMREQEEVLESLRDAIKTFETVSAQDTHGPQNADPDLETKETEEIISQPSETDVEETKSSDEQATDNTLPLMPEETESSETTADSETSQVITQSTLDFASLQELNPDICAWIEIEGTKIDYPVLQNKYWDKQYLSTAYNGTYYAGGSLFTEKTYNAVDFSDPVTVIYGHTMRAGTMFGELQKVYSNPKTFESHKKIIIYLPGETREYTVFAAVPYPSIHILHAYDFTKPYWYQNFFNGVRSIRSLYANIDEDAFPESGEQVIILSTCLNEDSRQRFLVMAVWHADT